MFQEFSKRKLNEYLNLPEFPDNKINLKQVKHSSLPLYIISFIEFNIDNELLPVDKKDFEELLRKAISFNINYVIRPKYSILKFLFGDYETRPSNYIKTRLEFFQFYGYYSAQILDFMNYNSLDIVSVSQIEYVIDEVNKKLLEEITGPKSLDSHRLNLVKILYYFFHDLSENNPINIKLPKKILSVYFADKGFNDIKARLDAFFSDEIFIQEAIEIMNPETKRIPKAKSEVEVSDKEYKAIVTKAKSRLINREASKKEIDKIIIKKQVRSKKIKSEPVSETEEKPAALPELNKDKLVIDDEIYSDDLLFASKFEDISPAPEIPESEKIEKLINELFCEETYRKKIIKKLFSRSENKFIDFLRSALDKKDWGEVTGLIESHFNNFKIDYYSEEAVKFVDILQFHFSGETDYNEYYRTA